MRGPLVLAVVAFALVVAPLFVHADSSESPLDSATKASRGSSSARLDALSSGGIETRLRAIRAAPFEHAPEAALGPLARLAAGREPTLAPAAAVAAYRIASSISRASLEAHETDEAKIDEAERAYRALSRDESARADVRRLAGYVASVLSSL